MTTSILNETPDKKLIQSPQIVTSKLGEDTVALNPDTGKYLSLNAVAGIIFELFSQPHTPEEVIDRLMQQFDVERNQCAEETEACILEMMDKGILKEA